MALEDRQVLHNRIISAAGNVSASLDPAQHKNDANNQLISSAKKFAAGRELGMSDEETLSFISNSLRRQQRKNPGTTEDEIIRRMVQSANSLSEVSEGAELRGVGYADEMEVDPFGQDQSDYYEYKPGDAQYEEQQTSKLRDEMAEMEDRYTDKFGNEKVRYQKGQPILKTGVNPTEYEGLAAELTERTPAREEMTPKSALRETLRQLESAKEQESGVGGLITRLVRGQSAAVPSKAAVAGRLEDELQYGPVQRGAEKALSAELNRRDEATFSGRRRAYNDIKAELEASDIAYDQFGPKGWGTRADAAIAAIPQSTQERVAGMPQIAQRADGIYVDPRSGNTV